MSLSSSDSESSISNFARDVLASRKGASARISGRGVWRVAQIAARLTPGAHPTISRLPHLANALTRLSQRLCSPPRRLLAVIPPEGGKTSLLTAAASALSKGAETPNVVILVPTVSQIGRIGATLSHRGHFTRTGYLASEAVRGADAIGLERGARATTVMTFSGFVKASLSRQVKLGDVDIFLVDDAHRCTAELDNAIRPFLAFATVVGASNSADATTIGPIFTPDDVAYAVSAQELRDSGVLAPVVDYVLAVCLDGDEPTDAARARLLKRKAQVDSVIDFLDADLDVGLSAALRERVTLFYGNSLAHARMFAQEFNSRLGWRGLNLAVLSGDDTPAAVAAVEKGLAERSITGVANAQLLVGNHDLPDVGVVINSGTDSMLRCLSQAGRVQRRDAVNGRCGYVVDTFLRVNDRAEGRPRFFFEASGSLSMARAVTMPRLAFSDVDAGPYAALDNDEDRESTADAPSITASQPSPVFTPPETQSEPDAEQPAQSGPVDTLPAVAKTTTSIDENILVSAEIDAVVRLIAHRDRASEVSPADQDYETLQQTVARLRLSARTQDSFFRAYRLVEEAITSGLRTEVEGAFVRVKMFDDAGRNTLSVHRDDVDKVARMFGVVSVLDPKTGDWLTAKEAALSVGEGCRAATLETLFHSLGDEWRHAGAVVHSGREIKFRLARSGACAVPALHRDEVGWLRSVLAAARPAPRADGEMDLRQACSRLRRPVDNMARKLWESSTIAVRSGSLIDPVEPVPFRIASDGAKEVAVLSETGLPWLARRLGIRFDGVVAYDPECHLLMADGLAALRLPLSRAADVKAAFELLRLEHVEGRPVIVGGIAVSATWVQAGITMGFALPRSCVNGLAADLSPARVAKNVSS